MKHVAADDMFKVTQAGIRYLEKFFGQKFKFSKYDQVFVPELGSNAMENVGCVTFRETLLHIGDKITDD